VAAYRMMKRGVGSISSIFTVTLSDRTSQQKARQAAQRLMRHQYATLVPGTIWRHPTADRGVAPAPYRVVLYRRCTPRMCWHWRNKPGLKAGDRGILRQVVADITNRRVIEAASTLPVLRP
jgi:adenylyl- and sulfurtransferase ThiI